MSLTKPSDVAVLKIDARNLPTVKIGDPQKSRVGEWVVAIGSPFGFENSVTAGIISAKSRALPDEGYVPFLQTDVAVNPGNSGGPLFNLNGKDIARSAELPPLVTDLAPGATAKLELWHKGKAKEISMSVGEMKTADAKGRKDSTP